MADHVAEEIAIFFASFWCVRTLSLIQSALGMNENVYNRVETQSTFQLIQTFKLSVTSLGRFLIISQV